MNGFKNHKFAILTVDDNPKNLQILGKTIKEINSFTLDDQFVVFTLDKQYFAVPVSIIERIERSVIITPIPGIPENVLGVINFKGQVIPVFNLRRMFGLVSRKMQLSDKLVIARTSKRAISFVVDMVTGVTDRTEQRIVPADKIFPGMEEIIEGLVFFEDGMILIYNLEKLITLENKEMLDLAMKKAKAKVEEKVKAEGEVKVGEKIKDKRKKIKVEEKAEVKAEGEVKDITQEKVKKAEKPKVVRAKRVKVSGKKTDRTVARKPKGRRVSK